MQRKISNIKYKLHSIPILLNMKNKSNVLYSIPCVKSCACTFCRVINTLRNNSSSNSNNNVYKDLLANTSYLGARSRRLPLQGRAATSRPSLRTPCGKSVSQAESTILSSQVVITPLSRIRSWRKLNSFIYHTNPANLPALAILLLSISFLSILGSMVVGSSCYATTETLGDSTASMTLDTSDVVVNVSAGQTGYASKSIVVSTNNTESYALTITAPATLKNSSTNSTNPWSYAYGQSGSIEDMSYTTFDGSTKQLEAGVESDGKAKVLAFSSTFAEGLSSGHYKAEVTLALTATPKATTGAKWSNGVDSGIEYMQDIVPGTSEGAFCKSTLPTHASITLKDSRDENSYTIVKMADGRCWMTQNLKIVNKTITSADSDVSSSFTIPASSISGFSNNTASNAYVSGNTGYYTWCAATAGACSSATSDGSNASSSICPKNWKLPTGGSSTSTSDFGKFASAEGIANSSAGSTKIRGAPYNFAYTGRVDNGSLTSTSVGYWWSRTASSSTGAYRLYIDSSSVLPGTSTNNYRYYGFAVRCVVAEPTTYTLSFTTSTGQTPYGPGMTNNYPTQTAQSTDSSHTFTIPNVNIQIKDTDNCRYNIGGWSLTDGGAKNYSLGDQITLTSDNPNVVLYSVLGTDTGLC